METKNEKIVILNKRFIREKKNSITRNSPKNIGHHVPGYS
jgi:hypothetical protein